MKKKIVFGIALLLLILFALWGREMYLWKSESLFAMDTYCTIKARAKEATLQDLAACIERYDQKFNAYQKDSAVYALNTSGSTTDGEILALITDMLAYNKKTEGAFDFTLKKLSDLWGFETENPAVPDKIDFSAFGAEKVEVAANKVVLNGVEVDFGAVLKGYVTDKLVAELRNQHVKEAILDLGGNVYTLGESKVGIKNPKEGSPLACAITVENKAVITSGVYQRYFIDETGKRWHHILDPKTGYPVQNDILSVTVIGENATECDVLSTAFLVMGKEKTFACYKDYGNLDIIVLTQDTLYYSSGLADSIEIRDEQYRKEEIQ